MFVKNNFDKGYVNGTLGKVIGFDEENLPIIETLRGKRIVATPASWTIEEDGVVKAEINQIPLRLAWAITVHKSQGMNLEAAEIDLSKSFVEGMGYVALSRLRQLSGLKLMGINDLSFLVKGEVLELDKNLKQMSQKAAEEIRKMKIWQKKKRQGQFLHSLPRVRESSELKNHIRGIEPTKWRPAYNVEEIRKKYPKAYREWSQEEETILRREYSGFIKKAAEVLERKPGAIRSRLKKLFHKESI